jgi:hypothetical protein
VLFEMSRDEEKRSVLEQVYKNHVRPVLIEGNKTCCDVGQEIITAEDPVLMSKPEWAQNPSLIMEHAEFIDKSDPSYEFPSSSKELRPNYYTYINGMLEFYDNNGAEFGADRFEKGTLSTFRQNFSSSKRIDRDNLKTKDIYNVTYDEFPKAAIGRFIRTLAFTVMDYTVAPLEHGSFSTASENGSILRDFDHVFFEDAERSVEPVDTPKEETSLVLSLPLVRIAQMDLSQILKMRPLFKDMREALHRFRNGQADLAQIREAYVEGLDGFMRVYEHLDKVHQGWVLDERKKQQDMLWIKPIQDLGLAFIAAGGVAGTFQLLGPTGVEWLSSEVVKKWAPSMFIISFLSAFIGRNRIDKATPAVRSTSQNYPSYKKVDESHEIIEEFNLQDGFTRQKSVDTED